MVVPEGKTVYIRGKKFTAGQELPKGFVLPEKKVKQLKGDKEK